MPNIIELPQREYLNNNVWVQQFVENCDYIWISPHHASRNCIVCQPQVSNRNAIAAVQVLVMKQCWSVDENAFSGIWLHCKTLFVFSQEILLRSLGLLKLGEGGTFLRKNCLERQTLLIQKGHWHWFKIIRYFSQYL